MANMTTTQILTGIKDWTQGKVNVRSGYFECSTGATTAAKAITAQGYVLTVGGAIKIKMTNANTANNATLNINSTGAKALYYDGARASSSNTWEAGEVLDVYYDGTNFQANNSAGGGKFATGEKVRETGIGSTATAGGGNLMTSGGVYNAILDRAIVGDIVGDPTAEWEPGPAEAYIDQKIEEVDARLDAQDALLANLNGSEVIVVADHTSVSSPDSQKIYREQGSTSYTDWMYQGGAWKEIATYSFPGIDSVPTAGSVKPAQSGGVYDSISVGNDVELALSLYAEVDAYPNNGVQPNKWVSGNNAYRGKFISVVSGGKYILRTNFENTRYAFLKSNAHTNGSTVDYATGSELTTASADSIITAPSDAKYLWVSTYHATHGESAPSYIALYDKTNITDVEIDTSIEGNEISIVCTPVPNEYTALEYIYGGNSICRIDTGISCSDSIEVECVFQDTGFMASVGLFGRYVDGGTDSYYLSYGAADDNTGIFCVNAKSSSSKGTVSGFTPSKRHHVVLNHTGIVLDGVFTAHPSIVHGTATSATIIINGSTLSSPASISSRLVKWWSFIIRDNGTEVFNGIPCKRIADGAIGMYDTVSNTFLGNSMDNGCVFYGGREVNRSVFDLKRSIDTTPTKSSKSLIESGGVWKAIREATSIETNAQNRVGQWTTNDSTVWGISDVDGNNATLTNITKTDQKYVGFSIASIPVGKNIRLRFKCVGPLVATSAMSLFKLLSWQTWVPLKDIYGNVIRKDENNYIDIIFNRENADQNYVILASSGYDAGSTFVISDFSIEIVDSIQTAIEGIENDIIRLDEEANILVFTTSVIPPVYTYETYMSLSPNVHQGSCVYGNYFWGSSMANDQGELTIRVFDLTNKTLVDTLTLTGVATNTHANAISFGRKYDNEDPFPCLYIPTGYANNDICDVYVCRITGTVGSLSISVIQTIHILNSTWTEWFCADNNMAWVRTVGLRFRCYTIPELNDSEVTLDMSQTIMDFRLPPIKYGYSVTGSDYQDCMYYKGKIWFVAGVPSRGGKDCTFIAVIDVRSQCLQTVIWLDDVGLTNGDSNVYEPEGLFIWNNQLYVAFASFIAKITKVDLT